MADKRTPSEFPSGPPDKRPKYQVDEQCSVFVCDTCGLRSATEVGPDTISCPRPGCKGTAHALDCDPPLVRPFSTKVQIQTKDDLQKRFAEQAAQKPHQDAQQDPHTAAALKARAVEEEKHRKLQRTRQEFTTLRPTARATRYVYHVHGHAKLHSPPSPAFHTHLPVQDSGQAVPFEVVLRLESPITSDGYMDMVRSRVRTHVCDELGKADSPYIVGDVMIRGVNLLHTILVDEDDPEGPAARVLS